VELIFRPLSDADMAHPNPSQYSEQVYDILATLPNPKFGDSSMEAFQFIFMSDVAALHTAQKPNVDRGIANNAMKFAAGRLYLGGATQILSKQLVEEIAMWYIRRIATRMVDIVMCRPPDPYDDEDARMVQVFRTHADLSIRLEIDPDGNVRRARPRPA
jgi:hypothetical protein